MSLEEFIPLESSEWWSQSTEVSEKMKEAAKKAGAGIKRTQKDEKKAKKNWSFTCWFFGKNYYW